MKYYHLIAYMSLTNEPVLKNFALSDCRKVKLHWRMLVVVLRRFAHVEGMIDKPAQIDALDSHEKETGMKYSIDTNN